MSKDEKHKEIKPSDRRLRSRKSKDEDKSDCEISYNKSKPNQNNDTEKNKQNSADESEEGIARRRSKRTLKSSSKLNPFEYVTFTIILMVFLNQIQICNIIN